MIAPNDSDCGYDNDFFRVGGVDHLDVLIIAMASLFAGAVDAIVGGGGLVLLPALFSMYPAAVPATLLGTNKSASVFGTSLAAMQYRRRVQMRWFALWPAIVAAFIGSFLGAWAVTVIDPAFLRKALPFILLLVLCYTLLKKNLGQHHEPHLSHRKEQLTAGLVGAVIGWYDGFFGPGTGSFFIFLLVRLLGYDFLHASASAKFLNVSTNIAAIILFASKGYIWWQIGLVMAAANMLGSVLGTRLALKHGAGFVRYVFIVVVGLLILKTGYDAF